MRGPDATDGAPVTPSELGDVSGARGRWYISKHDCIKHGQGDGIPCRPRCDDPWQADDPTAVMGNTFATWASAIAWADKWARRRA